jgi:formylglycine-generating enzyme required for sulfatase activity
MRANAWGIYGMHGGVREFCEKSNHDIFWHVVLENSTNNTEFICRGGCHYDEPKNCRSSSRCSYTDDICTGFRPIFIGN